MIENRDGDLHILGKDLDKSFPTSKVGQPGTHYAKWSSLFGVKPTGKPSFPPIKVLSWLEKGSCAIAIPDELVDHNISTMASTLVGKFIGKILNTDILRAFTQKKWYLKGQITITAMAKGFLSFEFSCNEDL